MSRDVILQSLRQHREDLEIFGIRSLHLFGSVARNEDSLQSDVDLLVDFASAPSFSSFMKLRIFLEDLLGRKVDLITTSGLRDRVRPYVEKDAIRVA